jgi:hypothetical protein
MGKQVYKLLEGGKIQDTRTGKIVAIDKSVGVAEQPFDDLESVGVWEWDADRSRLLEECLVSEPKNCTPAKLATAVGKDVRTVREWLSHPAFIRRLVREQANAYKSVSALRRRTIEQTLNKLAEKMDDMLDKDPASLTQTQVKQMANLLREFRSFRLLERTEFGEASEITEANLNVSTDTSNQSVLELLRKHPREMAALANVLLDQEQGVRTSPVEEIDATIIEEEPPPPAPPTPADEPGTTPAVPKPASVFDSLKNLGLPLS